MYLLWSQCCKCSWGNECCCPLTSGSSNMCVPLLVPHPSLTYSQISETSLSCELTLWCGAVGRDPKPLIRHLNSPLPAITSLAVSRRRVSTPRLQISQTERRDGTEPPCCSWVIYLFMEAFYSHFKGTGIIYRSTIGLKYKTFADRRVTGEAAGKLVDRERRFSGERPWLPFVRPFIFSDGAVVAGVDEGSFQHCCWHVCLEDTCETLLQITKKLWYANKQ